MIYPVSPDFRSLVCENVVDAFLLEKHVYYLTYPSIFRIYLSYFTQCILMRTTLYHNGEQARLGCDLLIKLELLGRGALILIFSWIPTA